MATVSQEQIDSARARALEQWHNPKIHRYGDDLYGIATLTNDPLATYTVH